MADISPTRRRPGSDTPELKGQESSALKELRDSLSGFGEKGDKPAGDPQTATRGGRARSTMLDDSTPKTEGSEIIADSVAKRALLVSVISSCLLTENALVRDEAINWSHWGVYSVDRVRVTIMQ